MTQIFYPPKGGGSGGGSGDSVILSGQTIDSAVTVDSPVYFDAATSTWVAPTNGTPQGFVGSVAGVVTMVGKSLTTLNLTPGFFYYYQPSGGISTVKTDVKIGYATGQNELLVDIDVEGIEASELSTSGASRGYMGGGGSRNPSTSLIGFDTIDETITEFTPSTTLASAIQGAAALNGKSKSKVVAGGVIQGVSSIDTTTPTTSIHSAVQATGKTWVTGVSSLTNGFASGGNIAAATTAIDGVFGLDTESPTSGVVSAVANYNVARPVGVSSLTKGYIGYGQVGGAQGQINNFTGLDSTNTISPTSFNVSSGLGNKGSSRVGLSVSTKGIYAGGASHDGYMTAWQDLTIRYLGGIDTVTPTFNTSSVSLSNSHWMGSGISSLSTGILKFSGEGATAVDVLKGLDTETFVQTQNSLTVSLGYGTVGISAHAS